nr:hypothetical protein [Tanacetum cinerariifolium]
MLWGFYHRINIDFAYLFWEDFVYQVVSRHQTTQQYGAILPIELTTDEIRFSKAYKEYYACAMGEAAPKPKVSAKKKKGDSTSSTTPPTPTPTTTIESALRLSATAKGKQPSRATTPIEPTDVQRTEAEQLKIILKRSRQETHISQQRGFGTDEGTGSKPGVPDVPSDDLEEEISWNSSDDEDVGGHEEGNKSDESDDERDEGSDDDSEETVKAGAGKDDDDDDDEDNDDNDEEEELAKSNEEDTKTGKGGDEVRESEGESDEEETRQEEEESFDPIPRTPEESEEESNNEEDQDLRLIQIQTDRLQDSLQRENDEFICNIDENMKKIIKGQVKNQEGPSAGSNRGSKRQKEGGEHATASNPSETAIEGAGRSTTGSQSRQMSASESAYAEEPVQTTWQMEEPPYLVFETGADDQPIVQTSQHPEWFSQPRRPPSPDRAWNTTLPAAQGDAQSWISDLARQTDARSSFNELLETPIDFSNSIMNRLNVDTLTPELLAGPTYKLMRGSCNSLTELEYHLEEVYKATTDQLDWVNPEGQQYPHNLLQPLPLIPNNRRRHEHCHPEASGRPSTGSGKLPEEVQPYEAQHVPTRSEAT